MYAMKRTIIQLLCLMILVGCQKYDIEVFNGPNTNLDRLNGNWVVINYWADWCAPCIKEIPELNEFADENADLIVYTFNFDELDIDDRTIDSHIKRIRKKFRKIDPKFCLLYTSPSPRDVEESRMPSSA